MVSGAETSFLKRYYTKLYGQSREAEDSPGVSRVNLARSIMKYLRLNPEGGCVLNLGSGPHSLERNIRTYKNDKEALKPWKWFSLDIANLPKRKMLDFPSHTQMNGEKLGFADGRFDVAVSSMALDFMPSVAIREVSRVLRTGGRLFATLHHPLMLKGEIDDWNKVEEVSSFWKYLQEEEVLLENDEEVRDYLNFGGLMPILIEEQASECDTWWYVEAKKTE